MKAEILLRRIYDVPKPERVASILTSSFAEESEFSEIRKTIEEMLALSEDGHLWGWKEIKVPVLSEIRRKWVNDWLKDFESNWTDKKTVTPFVLTGELAKDKYRLILDTGVECGYLNKDYSRKSKRKNEFAIFVDFIADWVEFKHVKEIAGLLWYEDEDALKHQRADKGSGKRKSLGKVYEDKLKNNV